VKHSRPGISWEGVRERLRAADAALANAIAPDPERTAAVFKQRAARLARRASGQGAPKGITALLFRVGQQRYAIEVGELTEVQRNCSISRVPGAGSKLAGVTAIRGEIRPVWHLERLLGEETASGVHAALDSVSGSGQVLLLRTAGGDQGLLVGDIEEIREIDLARCHAPSEALRHVRAIAPDSAIVLDTHALFYEEFS